MSSQHRGFTDEESNHNPENVACNFFLFINQSSHHLSKINLSDLSVSDKIETIIYTFSKIFWDGESAHPKAFAHKTQHNTNN
jgi:hypothetical protein